MTDAYFTVVCRAPENQGGDYRVAAEHLHATGLEDAKTLHSAHVQGLVKLLAACPQLEELDISTCPGVRAATTQHSAPRTCPRCPRQGHTASPVHTPKGPHSS